MLFSEYGGFVILRGSPTVENSHIPIHYQTNPSDLIDWKRARPIFYLIICIDILLPFPSRLYSILSSVAIVGIEVAITFLAPSLSDQRCYAFSSLGFDKLGNQGAYAFASDMLFYLCAVLVAFYVTYLLEIVNRRAFLDHRKCVESKYKLTFEKDEQERLLSSCLPRHLMKKVSLWIISIGYGFLP